MPVSIHGLIKIGYKGSSTIKSVSCGWALPFWRMRVSAKSSENKNLNLMLNKLDSSFCDLLQNTLPSYPHVHNKYDKAKFAIIICSLKWMSESP